MRGTVGSTAANSSSRPPVDASVSNTSCIAGTQHDLSTRHKLQELQQ